MNWRKRCPWMGLALLSWSPAVGQATTCVSVDSGGGQANGGLSYYPAMTPDGRFVAFASDASNLVPGDTNGRRDVFVHDRQTGQTTRVSVGSAGAQAIWGCDQPAVSSDGRYVAFMGESDDLVPGDTNGMEDVFLRDRTTGQTTRVSLDPSGAQLPIHSSDPCISADGRYVGFYSWADDLSTEAIYVRDVVTGTTTLMSVDSGGTPLTGGFFSPCISPDGRYVGFDGWQTSMPGDTDFNWDVFVHDRQTGSTIQASVDSLGGPTNGTSGKAQFSSDGGYVVFSSAASNLVPGDTNGAVDVFLRDLVSGSNERVSLDSAGAQGNGASWFWTSMSGDARFIAFSSAASNLVPGDTNGKDDVFLRDRLTGTTTRVSVNTSGAQAIDPSGNYRGLSVSLDGRFVAFGSQAPLDGVDSNGVDDIYVRDRMPATVTTSCFGDGTGAACPCGNSGDTNRGCENSASTGGAVLGATGITSLGNDTLHITCFGGRASALNLFLQGDTAIAPENFGDGVRCVGGTLKRLYKRNASLGVATAPQGAELSFSARSAALGDPISMGGTRHYQVYYRDPSLTFCPDPPGNTWNVSNAVSAVWDP